MSNPEEPRQGTDTERAEAWARIPEELHRRASALSRQLMRMPPDDSDLDDRKSAPATRSGGGADPSSEREG